MQKVGLCARTTRTKETEIYSNSAARGKYLQNWKYTRY